MILSLEYNRFSEKSMRKVNEKEKNRSEPLKILIRNPFSSLSISFFKSSKPQSSLNSIDSLICLACNSSNTEISISLANWCKFNQNPSSSAYASRASVIISLVNFRTRITSSLG